jgi:catechol 2,3-dioxygenase-like lactoylglutathione lyase family enzyme
MNQVAMNLEVQVLPISSVERSKEFYQRLGWRLDDDVAPTKDVRIVQFTPPGPDPKRTSYGSYCAFQDPDGNAWLVQEVTTRHPGRT